MTRTRHTERPYWVHSAPDDGTGEQRPCVLGEHCRERTVTIDDATGAKIITPALGYRPFCETDTRLIRDRLTGTAALPVLWLILAAELGEAPAGDDLRRSARIHAPMPVRGDVDELMRSITTVLTSWEDRVRANARLTTADRAGKTGVEVVTAAAATLAVNMSGLLALQPEPMPRAVQWPLPSWVPERWPDPAVQPHHPDAASVTLLVPLGGADAGLEVLGLHRRSLTVLGLTRRRPEQLLGVACYECQHRALVRAAPPRTDTDTVWYSRCRNCGHMMTEPQYRDHATRLAASYGGPKRRPDTSQH